VSFTITDFSPPILPGPVKRVGIDWPVERRSPALTRPDIVLNYWQPALETSGSEMPECAIGHRRELKTVSGKSGSGLDRQFPPDHTPGNQIPPDRNIPGRFLTTSVFRPSSPA